MSGSTAFFYGESPCSGHAVLFLTTGIGTLVRQLRWGPSYRLVTNHLWQMAPEVLHRVVRGPTTTTESHQSLSMVRPAILHDYHRCKVRNADYPAIIPMDGACVRGSFVSGLSDAAMRRLDIFEGSEYIRRHVKLKLLEQVGDVDGKGNVEGEEVEAETYVWCSPMSELENEEWDFAEFQREKMHRWVGSCAEHPG